MLTTIKVEQRHIDAGIRRLCEKCPIALAFIEHLKDDLSCSVCPGDPARISITSPGRTLYLLTIEVYNIKINHFIMDFDNLVKVKPFDFQIDIPEEYLKV